MCSSIHDYQVYSQYPLVTAQLQNKNLQLCYHSLYCAYANAILLGCNEAHAIHINHKHPLVPLHPTILTSSTIHMAVWEIMTATSCTDMKSLCISVESSSTRKFHYRVCHKYCHKVYAYTPSQKLVAALWKLYEFLANRKVDCPS